MPARTLQPNNTHVDSSVIAVGQLPPVRFSPSASLPQQISAYFRRLMASQHRNELVLPSVMQLSNHFLCATASVFEGLRQLQQQGFAYECQALDRPVIIRDPLNRQGAQRPGWRALSQELLMPWDPVRHATRNPLDIKARMKRI